MQQQIRRYQSLEELERDYEQKIAQVEDPVEKAEWRVKMAEAKVQHRQQEAQDRMIDAWKRLALVEYPQAAKFPELVRGETEDEIRQSAKEAHERVAALSDHSAGPASFDDLRRHAQDLYGRGGVVGGSTPAPPAYVPPDMAEERWAQNWAQRFNDAPRDIYGARQGLSPSDVDRYTRHRFTSHVKDRVRFWGQLTRSSGL